MNIVLWADIAPKTILNSQKGRKTLQTEVENRKKGSAMNQTNKEEFINVDVTLYGSLAKIGGGRHFAQLNIRLEPGACKDDLMVHLGIKEEERGYIFINAVLHDVPGLTTGKGWAMQEGDHVGIFSSDYLWPYQYRDGVRMAPALQEALREQGPVKHEYKNKRSE